MKFATILTLIFFAQPTLALTSAERGTADYLTQKVIDNCNEENSLKINLDQIEAKFTELKKLQDENKVSVYACPIFDIKRYKNPSEAGVEVLDGYQGSILAVRFLEDIHRTSPLRSTILLMREGSACYSDKLGFEKITYSLDASEPSETGSWLGLPIPSTANQIERKVLIQVIDRELFSVQIYDKMNYVGALGSFTEPKERVQICGTEFYR